MRFEVNELWPHAVFVCVEFAKLLQILLGRDKISPFSATEKVRIDLGVAQKMAIVLELDRVFETCHMFQ